MVDAQPPGSTKASFAVRILLSFIRVYQYVLSPYFGKQCRFTPTCSQYAADALVVHGAIKGTFLTFRRLLRCHPFCDGGYDPVP